MKDHESRKVKLETWEELISNSVLLRFEEGNFSVVSSPYSHPLPRSGVFIASLEIACDALFSMIHGIDAGVKADQSNPEIIFLDGYNGTHKEVPIDPWTGENPSLRIKTPGVEIPHEFAEFFASVLGEFLSLQNAILNNRMPELPPNIYEDDGQNALQDLIIDLNGLFARKEFDNDRARFLEQLEFAVYTYKRSCADYELKIRNLNTVIKQLRNENNQLRGQLKRFHGVRNDPTVHRPRSRNSRDTGAIVGDLIRSLLGGVFSETTNRRNSRKYD